MGIGAWVMELQEMPSLGKEDVQESEVGFSERHGSNSVGRRNDADGGLDMHAIFQSVSSPSPAPSDFHDRLLPTANLTQMYVYFFLFGEI